MARPKSNNVDYFPCYCKDGKTLFILESRWGNTGYAFFYKLWKRLGNADFHYIDLRSFDNFEYFRAKMGVSDTETTEILNKLAEMGVIDRELWDAKIIWSESFIDSVKDVWIKRKQDIPQKPIFLIQKQEFLEQNETETQVSEDHNPQSKVNKSKVNKSKGNSPETPPVDNSPEEPELKPVKNAFFKEMEKEFSETMEKIKAKYDYKEQLEIENWIKANHRGKHPQALIHSLNALIKIPDKPKIISKYLDKVLLMENQNYNATDHEKRSDELKKPGLFSIGDIFKGIQLAAR